VVFLIVADQIGKENIAASENLVTEAIGRVDKVINVM